MRRQGRYSASFEHIRALCFPKSAEVLDPRDDDMLHTVGSGDFAGACDILTDSGKAKLIAEQQAATCEAAAERWRSSLSPSRIDWLVHGRIRVDGYAAEDERKEIKLFGNPLGISNWAIYKHAGHERISDWGPGRAEDTARDQLRADATEGRRTHCRAPPHQHLLSLSRTPTVREDAEHCVPIETPDEESLCQGLVY